MKKFKKTVIILAMLTTLTGCTSKETKKFNEYMDDGKYQKAAEYYDKHDSSIDVDNLSKLLKESSDSIVQDYKNDKISFENASDNINALLSMSNKKTKSELSSDLALITNLNESRTNFESAENFYNHEKYKEAIERYEKVIQEDINYDNAQNKIQLSNNKLEEIKAEEERRAEEIKQKQKDDKISEIKKLVDLEKYQQVNETLYEFSSECDDVSTAEEVASEIEAYITETMNNNIDGYFADYDYEAAYNYLENINYYFNYSAVIEKMDTLENDFVENTITNAEKEAAVKNYANACSIIEVAFKAVGEDNESLNKAYNEYRKHIDVYITDIPYMSCDGRINTNDSLVDNTNVTHNRSFYISNYGSPSIEFFTNKNYSKFSGIIACSSNQRNNKDSMFIEIYGDGNLIYTSSVMTASTLPESFDIDISGVTVLKIRWTSSDEYSNKDIATIYDGMFIHKDENVEKPTSENTEEKAN